MTNNKNTTANYVVNFSFVILLLFAFSFSNMVQASLIQRDTSTDQRNKSQIDSDEEMPSFPGGQEAMDKYIKDNIRYPEAVLRYGIQGQVKIRFCVSETGEIENVDIMNGLFPSCDAEAKRVVKSMPKWNPGQKDGVNVPVYFSIPINFRLNKNPKEFLTEVIYIYDRKEISANDMNLKLEENTLADEDAVLANSALYDGESLKEYGNRYNGRKVLIISSVGKFGQNLHPELSEIVDNNIMTMGDSLPLFPGGEKGLKKYIRKNIKYPPTAKKANHKGTVIVQFLITETGEVTNARVVKGFNPLCNAEAVRVIRKMPKWIMGKKANFSFALPIVF